MSIAKLKSAIRKLEKLPIFIEVQADNVISKEKADLIGANKEQLNEQGKGSDDKSLVYLKPRSGKLNSSGAYTDRYDKFKSKKGKQTDHVDLRLSGKFQRGITLVKFDRNHWVYVGNDDKTLILEANYGDHILGITEDNLQIFSSAVMEPALQNKVDNYLTR